jgi:hypothetical protein
MGKNGLGAGRFYREKGGMSDAEKILGYADSFGTKRLLGEFLLAG